MTQPYAHCPFCLEEFDLACDSEIIQFGNMEMIQIQCPKHGEVIIISDNIYGKYYGGEMIADCPKCNQTIFLSRMTHVIGNG
jgi:hypothetical protein